LNILRTFYSHILQKTSLEIDIFLLLKLISFIIPKLKHTECLLASIFKQAGFNKQAGRKISPKRMLA
jgi:hypothetical protein